MGLYGDEDSSLPTRGLLNGAEFLGDGSRGLKPIITRSEGNSLLISFGPAAYGNNSDGDVLGVTLPLRSAIVYMGHASSTSSLVEYTAMVLTRSARMAPRCSTSSTA